jgi:3-deoxy-manno-octulosonate cytidylyltransferase (CMP-KDO synthetase)
MQASRLPGKPLADICGKPMIVHVWQRGVEADIGQVVVASDSEDIIAAITAAGGKAVLTKTEHASGSDRVFEALEKVDPEQKVEIVVNLQGDLPTIEPGLISACIKPLLDDPDVDIATLVSPITEEDEKHDPAVVKLIGTPTGHANILRALYFTRVAAPAGPGPLYHHIGIYAYRRKAIARFVKMPQSPLELREKLEQLRALEAGMRIDAAIVDTVPIGVDTPADLQQARMVMDDR